jgi:hypothetical protein
LSSSSSSVEGEGKLLAGFNLTPGQVVRHADAGALTQSTRSELRSGDQSLSAKPQSAPESKRTRSMRKLKASSVCTRFSFTEMKTTFQNRCQYLNTRRH